MSYCFVFFFFGGIGVNNLRTIQGVMEGQTMEYVFPYSQFSFPTDIAFLVVCEGRRSAFFQVCIFLLTLLRFSLTCCTFVIQPIPLFVHYFPHELTTVSHLPDEHQYPPSTYFNLPSRPIQIPRSGSFTAPSEAGDVQEFGGWGKGGRCKSP
jgi:Conserved membrane protein (DUF2044).